MPRYTVSGLPPQAAAGHTAFMPHFNRLAASSAQQYKGQTEGQPGTRGIPVNTPQVLRGQAVSLALKGQAASSDAPNMIYPNQYFAYPEPGFWPGAGMPIQMYDPVRPQDTTMIPVPAEQYDYRGRSALNASVRQAVGGRAVLRQAKALLRWPNRGTGAG
jgi:hypothetical protein